MLNTWALIRLGGDDEDLVAVGNKQVMVRLVDTQVILRPAAEWTRKDDSPIRYGTSAVAELAPVGLLGKRHDGDAENSIAHVRPPNSHQLFSASSRPADAKAISHL